MTDFGTGARPVGPGSGLAPYFANSDDHARYRWFADSTVRVLFDATATGGQLSLVENRTDQPFASPVHVHDGEDEAFVVIEGRLRAWVGNQRRDVDEGDVAFLPRGIPHAFRVMTPSARFLVIGVPAGLEQLYRAAGWDLSTPPPEGWTVSVPQIAATESERGNRILGPPPDAEDLVARPVADGPSADA